MPCNNPLTAYRLEGGTVTFDRRAKNQIATLTLPCGHCIGCRVDRSREWTVRCVHEMQLWEKNCFITLTYRDDHLPAGHTLVYRDFQLFMMKLRKTRPNIRFFMCGEYGEKNLRPHYHAILFNFMPDDLKVMKSGRSKLYTSDTIAQCWNLGFHSIGEANAKTAAYVSRYIMGKVFGDAAEKHYEYVDTETGEIFDRTPEFVRMSLKPGIGAGWYEKFGDDAHIHDNVVLNGKQVAVPTYYDRLLKRKNPERLLQLKEERQFRALTQNIKDGKSTTANMDLRLARRETVMRSRYNAFTRTREI